jgi:hypothetical protein
MNMNSVTTAVSCLGLSTTFEQLRTGVRNTKLMSGMVLFLSLLTTTVVTAQKLESEFLYKIDLLLEPGI